MPIRVARYYLLSKVVAYHNITTGENDSKWVDWDIWRSSSVMYVSLPTVGCIHRVEFISNYNLSSSLGFFKRCLIDSLDLGDSHNKANQSVSNRSRS